MGFNIIAPYMEMLHINLSIIDILFLYLTLPMLFILAFSFFKKNSIWTWNTVGNKLHPGKKKVERIRRIPSHGVAALRAFGIDQANPFRDCIDSLLIDLQG